MSSTANRKDFTEGGLLKKMFLFAIPMILSTFLQLLFNAADVAIVGQDPENGTTYQAAVGATSSMIHLIVNLFMGISVGANVAMATAFGAKDEDRQHRIVHTSIALSSVGGVAIMILGASIAKPVMALMQTPENVLPYAVLYMQIFFLGAPANIVYNFGASLFRAVGETKKPLFYLFVAGVINVLINVITVVFLDMHVIGVALGTVISQYVSAVWVLLDLMKEKGATKLVLKKVRFYKRELIKILFLGIPTGITNCLFSVSNVLIQSTINSYGDIVMSGSTIAVNVDGFLDAFSSSFGGATLTVIGQNIGAKKPERIRKAIGSGALLLMVSYLIADCVLLLLGEYIYRFFNSSPLVVEQALVRMRITSLGYFLVVPMSIYGAALRGMGYSIIPMIINLICTCLFRVFWLSFAYPLAPSFSMVLYSYPITWVLSGLAHVALYYILERKFFKKQREKVTE